MGELGGGGDEKKRFCLIDLAQQVVDESEPEAGGRARERVGMLWSRAADHTTHRKSLPCFGTSLLPLVKAYSARHAALTDAFTFARPSIIVFPYRRDTYVFASRSHCATWSATQFQH